MQALIEMLEKAEAAARALDRDIFLAVTPDWLERGIILSAETIPHYTASLDCALTLVPEGWLWETSRTGCGTRIEYFASVNRGEFKRPANGYTPALALCIAALRARAGDVG